MTTVVRWTETPATLGDIELSQYHFISLDSGHMNSTVRDTTKSVAYLLFSFERAIGFYVLQVYTPLVIIVMSSWVSFWLVSSYYGQFTYKIVLWYRSRQRWVRKLQQELVLDPPQFCLL